MRRNVSRSQLAHLLLLLVVVVWGATFVLVKEALADSSPLLFNLLRMTLAALALALVNLRHLKGVSMRSLARGALAGLFLAAGYQFQTVGLARTTPAKSAFITGMVVVFVPLLTLFTAIRPKTSPAPGWNALGGGLLAFSGLFLLTTPAGTQWRDLFRDMGPGDLTTLFCALAFAAHLITLAHVAPQMQVRQLSTLQISFAALFMLLTLPLQQRLYLHASLRLLLAIAITGLLATAAAFTIQSWAQKHLPATHTAILFTLEPVFAGLTSFVLLHERLGRRSLSGAALILCAIALLELLPAAPPVPNAPA